MVDFIEEVEERLRSDRYRAILRKAWPWAAAVLTAVVAAFLGVWGYQTWNNHNIAQASTVYDKALTELAQGDPTGAYNDFGPVAASGPAGYRTLALMSQGDIRLSAGKGEDAARLFDQAAKAAPDPVFADLAKLRAALSVIDTAPYAQVETRLTPLIGQGKPFDLQAREALAVAKLAAGKTAAARSDFNALTLTIGVSQAMRDRAQVAMSLIDAGETGAVLAAAKTAATMPPPKLESLPGAAPQGRPSPSSPGAAAPQPQGESGSAQ